MSDPEAREPADAPWLDAAAERLGRDAAPVRRLFGARRGRVREALAALGGRGRAGEDELDAELSALLELIGLSGGEPELTVHDIGEIVRRVEATGLGRGALPQIVQAYVRAIGRIVAVESTAIVHMLRDIDPAQRSATVTELLDSLLPTSVRGFDVLHRAMLQDALIEGSPAVDDSESEQLAVAMVDIVGSTRYLAQARPDELERLVDAIFVSGQAATADRAAHIVKYVGDGVFLAGHEVPSVADAALELIARLQSQLPLQARGGISCGFVVQRAGDLFGMPVNLAQALTKAARPGTILLSGAAADQIGSERRGRLRRRCLPNPAFGEQRVATLHPTATGAALATTPAPDGAAVLSAE
jgi:class 3 adenylate cyclase